MFLAVIMSAGEITSISFHNSNRGMTSTKLSVIRSFDGLEEASLINTISQRVPDVIRMPKRNRGNGSSYTGLFCVCIWVCAFVLISAQESAYKKQSSNRLFYSSSIITYIHSADGRKSK